MLKNSIHQLVSSKRLTTLGKQSHDDHVTHTCSCSRATGQQMMIFDSLGSPDEAFISENVCTSILSESKSSIKRCKEVRKESIMIFITSSQLLL